MNRIQITNLNAVETLSRDEMHNTQGGFLGALIAGTVLRGVAALLRRRRPRVRCFRTWVGVRCVRS